jgi:phosphomannomutase/phosphoglucomutase
MAPFCKDEEKYKVVDDMVKKIQQLKNENIQIDGQFITEVLTINGIRFFILMILKFALLLIK